MADDKIRLALEVLLKDKNFKRKLTESENVMKKSARKQKGFINSIKKSWIGISVAIGGTILVIKDIIKKTIDHEKAVAKLNNTLIKNGTATKGQIKDLLKYNDTLQDTTGFSNDEIIAAQAMLGTFKLTADEIKKLTPRLLDMNAATETATGSKQDLVVTATQLGKVFTGYESSLSRMGVTMTDTEKKNLKLATGMEKVNIVTGVLDNNFKGTAETVGKTLGGQINILKGSFEDLQKSIGELITPVLVPLVKALTKAFKWITSLPKPIKFTAIAVAGLTIAVKLLSVAMGILSFNPVVLGVTAAVVALGSLVVVCKKAYEWMAKITTISGLGWQKISDTKDLGKAKKDLEAFNKQLKEYEKRINAAGKSREQWKADKLAKAQDEYNKKINEEGYSVKKAGKWWTKRIEKIDEMNIAWTKYELKVNNTTNAIEEYNKESGKIKPLIAGAPGKPSVSGGKEPAPDTTDMKKAWEDYYTFIGDLRQVDIDKENERHENVTATIEELHEAGKITEEEYLLALEAIQSAHLERMGEIGTDHDTLEEEKASKKEKLAEKRRKVSLQMYGKYYKDLTKAQKKELGEMLKDWEAIEISKKELSNTFVDGFLGGIDSMKSSSKDVAISMIKQFASMIAGKLAALSALHFASLNIPAGVAALAAAGVVKAMGGTLAATIAGYAKGGEVAYAASGLTPRGTDTVPAMLTPGEEVLPVPVANAYRSLMNAVAMPSAGGTSNVNNNTTNEGDSIINNEFNNNFEGNTIDEMLELSQNTGTDLLRR